MSLHLRLLIPSLFLATPAVAATPTHSAMEVSATVIDRCHVNAQFVPAYGKRGATDFAPQVAVQCTEGVHHETIATKQPWPEMHSSLLQAAKNGLQAVEDEVATVEQKVELAVHMVIVHIH